MSQTTKVTEHTRETADWSKLPRELLGLIVLRMFSTIELKRFRSICTSWRSSVSGANNIHFLSFPLILLRPLVVCLYAINGNVQIVRFHCRKVLSRAAFFRVTISSSPDQGWLIKSDSDLNSGKFHLLNSLSRLPLKHSSKSINLLEFTVSEIQEAYAVLSRRQRKTARGFKRVVHVTVPGVDFRVLVIGSDGKIRYWNKEKKWSRVKDQVAQFSDIIVHKGLTYALDTKGVILWISSSYEIYRYGPSVYENITSGCCRDKRFVECCGVLYIVDLEENVPKRKAASSFYRMIHDDVGNVGWETERDRPKTVGFKVYKMDEEIVKWVEVKSLGDYAFVMATDTCFSVLAHDFYGCLPNSIYFADKEDEIKVFKLDDGSIETMSEAEQSCFQMFVPSFL